MEFYILVAVLISGSVWRCVLAESRIISLGTNNSHISIVRSSNKTDDGIAFATTACVSNAYLDLTLNHEETTQYYSINLQNELGFITFVYISNGTEELVFQERMPPWFFNCDTETYLWLGWNNTASGLHLALGEGWTIGTSEVIQVLHRVDNQVVGIGFSGDAHWKFLNDYVVAACPGFKTRCEDGWTEFNGHCYSAFKQQRSANDATDACHQLDANSLSLNGVDEEEFIKTFLNQQYAQDILVHLGLTVDMQWLSAQGDQFSGDIDKTGSQSPTTDDCIYIQENGSPAWADCDQSRMFMCQFESTAIQPVGFQLNGYTFVLSSKKKTHTKAQEECQDDGGSLALYFDDTTFKGYIATHSLEIWSAYRLESVFKWDDGRNGSLSELPLPSDSSVNGLSCALLISTGEWLTMSCDIELPYICEKPANEHAPHCTTGPNVDANCACYWSTEVELNWRASLLHCEESGGTLAMINNNETSNFLEHELLTTYGAQPRLDGEYYWIGLTDGVAHGVYRWINTRVLRWSHWAADNPVRSLQHHAAVLRSTLEWYNMNGEILYNAFCQTYTDEDFSCTELDLECLDSNFQGLWLTELHDNTVHESDPYVEIDFISQEDCIRACYMATDFLCTAASYNSLQSRCGLTQDEVDLISTRGMTTWTRQPRQRSKKCYISSGTASEYDTAIATCSTLNTSLLLEASQEDSLRVTALLSQENTEIAWLDLHGTQVKGVTQSSNGQYPYWTNWRTGPLYTCVMHGRSGNWRSEPCSEMIATVLCMADYDYHCVHAPNVRNSFREFNSENMSFNYTCHEGYEFLGGVSTSNDTIVSRLRSCDECTAIDVTALGSCEPACERPPGDPYTLYVTDGLALNSTLNATCRPGYYFDNLETTFTTKCVANASDSSRSCWERLETCEELQCNTSEPMAPPHTNLVVNSNDDAYFQCDGGFAFEDGRRTSPTECSVTANAAQPRAEWTPQPPPCIEALTTTDQSRPSISDSTGLMTPQNLQTSTVATSITLVRTTSTRDNPFAFTTNDTTIQQSMLTSSTTADNVAEMSSTPESVTHTTTDDTFYWTISNSSNTNGNKNDMTSTQATNPFKTTGTITETTSASTIATVITTKAHPQQNCPVYPPVNYAFKSTTSRLPGTPVTYTCWPGYQFDEWSTSRTVFCLSNAQWNLIIQGCHAPECPPPPPVTNSMFSSPVSLRLWSHVSYMCQNGFIFPSGLATETIECTRDLRWNKHPGNCTNRCSPPPIVNNCDIVELENEIRSTSTLYQCQQGFFFPDGTKIVEIMCMDDGQWTPVPECIITTCPAIELTRNTTVNSTTTSIGTFVEIRCDDGYSFLDNMTSMVVLCEESQSWNASHGPCSRIDCGQPPEVAFSTREGNDTWAYSEFIYTCERGMRHEDGLHSKSIQCTQKAKWSINHMSCGHGRCQPLPTVDGAIPDSLGALNGSLIKYTCDMGHEFQDGGTVLSVFCNGTEWNFTGVLQSGCSAIHCPVITVNHAQVRPENTSYTASVRVTCDPGYTRSDNESQITQCGADQMWTHNITDCHLVDCGPPPSPAMQGLLKPQYTNTTYGETATYQCYPGFWFARDDFTRTSSCELGGEWLPVINGNCKGITCPEIFQFDGKSLVMTGIAPGSTVNASCADGMVFPGDEPFIWAACLSGGQWSKTIPDCKNRTKVKFEPPPTEAEDADVIGTSACAVIAAFGVAVVILDLPSMYNGLITMWNNVAYFRQIVRIFFLGKGQV